MRCVPMNSEHIRQSVKCRSLSRAPVHIDSRPASYRKSRCHLVVPVGMRCEGHGMLPSIREAAGKKRKKEEEEKKKTVRFMRRRCLLSIGTVPDHPERLLCHSQLLT